MKKVLVILLASVLIFSFSACSRTVYNKQVVDLAYGYDYAIILMPNGSIVEGKVQSWTDFEDGDQIQVKINGKTYLTHIMNVVLIKN